MTDIKQEWADQAEAAITTYMEKAYAASQRETRND